MAHHNGCHNSANHMDMISSHVGNDHTVKYFEIVHIDINVITYCCNCYILLIIIVMNLLVCLTYKLKFYHKYVCTR